eukprot:TRINITY_DN48280_c0_g1_i1.p1 TRINITY_DN48280_c0_g1~~TRINITY_DN48280_c0_g1_i1.p1  ORF type:complete len:358 (-),score=35.61 TRINITY_DN48280_c0_g1_i1:134-1207(-)
MLGADEREMLVEEGSEGPPARRMLPSFTRMIVACVAATGCSALVVDTWPRWWVAIAPSRQFGRITATSEGQILTWNDGDIVNLDKLKAKVNLDQKWGSCKRQDTGGPQGSMYCCTQGNPGSLSQSFECSPLCFPGHATVKLRGRENAPVSELAVGDHILVRHASGSMLYEPILGFLHAVRGEHGVTSSFLTVEHSDGTFRASANHVVFVVSSSGTKDTSVRSLHVGDRLLISNGNATSYSTILSLRHDAGKTGMYAPLTASGTIVVDGVVSSNYATAGNSDIPHAAMHASFFPLRAYKRLFADSMAARFLAAFSSIPSIRWHCGNDGKLAARGLDEIHPLPAFYYRVLKLHKLLPVP